MLKNNLLNLFKNQLFYIFLLAFAVRSVFVFLDYPFIFHPDEPTVVNSTINLRYNPNPMHFDWPTFYYYFNYPFFYIYEKIYFLLNDFGFVTSVSIDSLNYYILSRFLTSIFGAGTCIVVYLILKNLGIGKSLSLLGACIMAIIPFHVTRSAQALTDVPMVFFAGLAIYFLTLNLSKFNEKFFLWACFFAGLSVSTKYNGYMIFLSLALFLLLIKGFSLKDFTLYFKSGLASFLGFFIGTPYSVFDYETFLVTDSPKGALWQFTNVGRVDLNVQLQNFVNNFLLNNYSLMGYVPMVASLIFILWFLLKREFLIKDSIHRFQLILIIQYIFIFWSVSGVKLQRSHYLILAYLFLPLFTILLVNRLQKYLIIKYIIYSITVLLCIYSLYVRIGEVSLVKFYNQVRLNSDSKNYFVLYNRTETKSVLEKLDLPNSKIDPISKKYPSKVTHAILTYNICLEQKDCKFELIDKIESRSDSDVIYVFKIIQNK